MIRKWEKKGLKQSSKGRVRATSFTQSGYLLGGEGQQRAQQKTFESYVCHGIYD